MLKNDSTPAAASPETSNNKKCTSALKTVLAKRREISLPSVRKRQDVDSQNFLKNTLPPLWAPLQSGKNEDRLNASEIKSGIALKRVYNIEKAEVVNPNFMKKEKKDKAKEIEKRLQSQLERARIRQQLKKPQKIKEPVTTNNTEIKNQEKLTPQQKLEEKLRKRSNAEKALNDRRAVSQPAFSQPPPPPGGGGGGCPSPPDRSENKKSLESRLTTKIWQILSRDMFLLDHDKFNSQIQATNSETKEYIISVIKKCNNKQIKRLNRPKLTQTSKENSFSNSYRAKKRAMKIAVRRRVWALAKASIKRSKHWSQFLAENHIIVENINIDKFDLSLIDLEALGIENKLLKRTVTWLFN